jgi:hypothetical protein
MLARKVLDDVKTVNDLPKAPPAIYPHAYICFVRDKEQYYEYDHHEKSSWVPYEFSMHCSYYHTNADGFDQNLNWAKVLMRDKCKGGLLGDDEWEKMTK